MKNKKFQRAKRRKKRVASRVSGSSLRPRLSVFRSNKHLFAQVIDDQKMKTLVSASDIEIDGKGKTKSDKAKMVGFLLAKKAKEKKIAKVIFDRGAYHYHGRIKALAEGAREKGLEF